MIVIVVKVVTILTIAMVAVPTEVKVKCLEQQLKLLIQPWHLGPSALDGAAYYASQNKQLRYLSVRL